MKTILSGRSAWLFNGISTDFAILVACIQTVEHKSDKGTEDENVRQFFR